MVDGIFLIRSVKHDFCDIVFGGNYYCFIAAKSVLIWRSILVLASRFCRDQT